MSTAFWPAPDVEQVAEIVIEQSHEHLAEADIRYAFRSEPKKTKGRVALATVQRVTGVPAYLADGPQYRDKVNPLTGQAVLNEDTGEVQQVPVENAPFFLVLVWNHAWQAMSQPQRNALIDHELCHIREDDNGGLVLIGHDLEEFTDIVKRHGQWSPDIAAIIKAAEDFENGQSELGLEVFPLAA